MTGYNKAHGDTAAVRFDLNNNADIHRAYRAWINRVSWFDDATQTWCRVQEAANAVKAFVITELLTIDGVVLGDSKFHDREELSGELHEIYDADLDAVNWVDIVISVLTELNLENDRDLETGLADWLTS